MSLRPLLLVVGPTASGKTAVAVELALALQGEIVGLDSMQVHRGLPILSAAPSPQQRQAVPHHLVEEAEPGSSLDVQSFRERVLECVSEIRARGRQPILVGGSGLYVSAVVEGLSALPASDPAVRRELADDAARQGPGWLHAELARLDPASAARLHPNDEHRLVRALEVCRLTGRPYSELLGKKRGLPPGSVKAFGLDVPRAELYRRVEARAERMLASGALLEVARAAGVEGKPRAAGPAGLASLGTARQMLGVPELAACLAGELDAAEALRLLARNTRRFARRQLTWFRRMPGLRWIPVAPGQPAADIARAILKLATPDC